jgi:SAM-dependent methyltransferase
MPSFLDKITPPRMLARLQTLCGQRPDIQVLRWMVGEPKFLEWAHSVAVCTDDESRACVPPFPPLEIRQYTAAAELEFFLWTGVVDMQLMLALYDEFRGTTSVPCPAVLDFGCGCGRMLRFVSGHPEHWAAYGCDVKAANADWCRDNLAGAKVTHNNVLPPLPYPNKTFDLIFSLSIFTHLPEKNAILWLDEMHRILAPQGLFIATTHGFPALNIIKGSAVHQQMFKMDRARTETLIEELPEKKYIFLHYDENLLAAAQAGEEYGNTFIHPSYIEQRWDDRRFKFLRHLPAGLRGWQDVVVLQRR